MSQPEDKCVVPAQGPTSAPAPNTQQPEAGGADREGQQTTRPMVGREAPDFEASAYVDGGFKNIRLSSYRGQCRAGRATRLARASPGFLIAWCTSRGDRLRRRRDDRRDID